MARGDTYTCRTCGATYTYCDKCAIVPEPHKGNGFCTKEHAKIFSILSKHGCHLATAEETLKALKALNIEDVVFTPSIQAHIDAIKAEAGIAPVVEPIIEEVIVEYDQTSKKKKKW